MSIFNRQRIVIAITSMIIAVPFFVTAQVPAEETFEARVTQVLAEKTIDRPNGSQAVQQDLKLNGLTGAWKGRDIEVSGVSAVEVVSANRFQLHDRVLVNHSIGPDNQDVFYVVDYVRSGYLYALAALFIAIIIWVGRRKGIKALLGLGISFLVIMGLIVPQILAGRNPVLVGIVGSFLILMSVIYIAEGFNRKANIAAASISIVLIITALLALLFTSLARLTGLAQEEATYLVGIGSQVIDFRGLLLTSFLIGILGVLDDLVISQIETVEQLHKANHDLSRRRLFKLAFNVGNSHLAAVVNTLFLAYTGAALPLLLLFGLHDASSQSFAQIINTELIATEIVRTLVGSIGLALAVPIATFFAVHYSTVPVKAPEPVQL
ncbi:MAG: YibE/F family protein [Candidatus Buchananbacteria bacterium]|nr:YibE/F family protein [Candidatus Buchananbacteria bacterium]